MNDLTQLLELQQVRRLSVGFYLFFNAFIYFLQAICLCFSGLALS